MRLDVTLGQRLVASAERFSETQVRLFVVVVIALFALGDYFTGAGVAFTALYMLPLSVGAWFGRRAPVISAVACAFVWLGVELLTRVDAASHVVTVWNFAVQVVVFVGVALLVHQLRLTMVEERRELINQHQRALAAERGLQHAQRLSTVGKLAAGVAHELGTPLNVTQAWASMIASGSATGPDAERGAKTIVDQAESMTRIVRQLVDFARANKPHRTPHSLDAVVDSSLNMLQPLARKREVVLERRVGDALVAEVDASQLQQVFSNLVVNALHASQPGGRVELEVTRQRATPPSEVGGAERDYAVVRVRDHGHGLAPEVLAHLFEPFVTTKEVGEGTGLGLAVAHGIVREHAGWMTAENLPDGGACFRVFLPLSAA